MNIDTLELELDRLKHEIDMLKGRIKQLEAVQPFHSALPEAEKDWLEALPPLNDSQGLLRITGRFEGPSDFSDKHKHGA